MRGMQHGRPELDASPSCSSRVQATTFRAPCRIARRGCIQWPRLVAGQQQLAAMRSGSSNGDFRDDDDYSELPTKFELMQRPDKAKPLVRVRLSVHYRVHSRQILCIGGSQIPLGWSFLSIAKVPMTWNSGDIWTCEVRSQLVPAAAAPLLATRQRLCMHGSHGREKRRVRLALTASRCCGSFAACRWICRLGNA